LFEAHHRNWFSKDNLWESSGQIFIRMRGSEKAGYASAQIGGDFNAETQRRGEMGWIVSDSPHRARAAMLMKMSAFHNHFISILSLKRTPLPKLPQRTHAFRSIP
jgi:hypothetical protein